MDNKFHIVIQGRNVENWIKPNLASILNQSYQNWRCTYVNDASDDQTDELYHSIVRDDPRFTYIENETQKLYSRSDAMEPDKDPDVIWVELDGDDWLVDKDVLSNYNKFYNDHDCWLTYGRMFVWTGGESVTEANPQNTPYPDHVKQNNLYRQDVWRASHLRTFRNFLWMALDKNDLISKINGKWFHHAMDLAIMFPLMEMCPPDKVQPVDFPSIIWNAHPSKSQGTVQRESSENWIFEKEIREADRYRQVRSREELRGEKILKNMMYGQQVYNYNHM